MRARSVVTTPKILNTIGICEKVSCEYGVIDCKVFYGSQVFSKSAPMNFRSTTCEASEMKELQPRVRVPMFVQLFVVSNHAFIPIASMIHKIITQRYENVFLRFEERCFLFVFVH